MELTSCVWSIRKLQSDSEAVREELVEVFGINLQFEIESEPQSPASNQTVVIALAILFALSMMGLMVAAGFVIR